MAKFEERIKAREMRRQGWSVRGIAKELGVSKGTSSRWCMDIRLTEEQRQTLMKRDSQAARRGSLIAAENKIKERLSRMANFMKIGARKVGRLSKRDLFIAGLALYWAEGSKKNRRVELINSDPAIIKIWISWLKTFAEVGNDDLTLCVGINEIHIPRIGKVQEYWSLQTGIPMGQFRSPSFKKVRNRKVYDNYDQHFGSLCVRTRRSTNLNYEILGEIEKMGNEAGSW